jgi:hypothetical protein
MNPLCRLIDEPGRWTIAFGPPATQCFARRYCRPGADSLRPMVGPTQRFAKIAFAKTALAKTAFAKTFVACGFISGSFCRLESVTFSRPSVYKRRSSAQGVSS